MKRISESRVMIVSALIGEKLIDELNLFVNPVALGNGVPIFQQIEGVRQLRLMNSPVYPCGIALLQYEFILRFSSQDLWLHGSRRQSTRCPDPAGAGHCRDAINQRCSSQFIVWNDVFGDGGGLRCGRSILAIQMA